MEGQVLERKAETGATASGAGTTSAWAATRFRERPAKTAGRSQTSALRTTSARPWPQGSRPAWFEDQGFRGR